MSSMKPCIAVLAGAAMIAFFATAGLAGEKEEHAAHAGHAEHGATETGHSHGDAAEPTLFTGEVIDLTCFTAHPETGQGAEHASCAKTCLEKGLPAGLLVGDRLYVALMHDHSAPSKSLASYAGQVVNVKGTATESHGSWFLTIHSIEGVAKAAAK